MTLRYDAYHLPGLPASSIERWHERTFAGDVTLRVPVIDASSIDTVAARLVEARRAHLEPMSTAHLVHAIGQAARRIANPSDELGHVAHEALPSITRLSREMIGLILERAAHEWSPGALRHLVETELDGGTFDRFSDDRIRRSRPRVVGPRLIFHIFSGNVPGVAITSLVRGLLVRGAGVGKMATGEPLLAALFAHALDSVDPDLASTLGLTWWQGGDEPLEAAAMGAADTIVVYGGTPVIRSVRSRAPAAARLVEHGPRASIGLVGRAALRDRTTALATATRVAWATAMFDQQGCVSPHTIWVEATPAATRGFARRLGRALSIVGRDLPRGEIDAGDAGAIRDVRAAAEFRAIRGEDTEVFAGDGTAWTVIFEATPAFRTSCLNRTIHVKPIDRLESVASLLEPARGFIQTAAIEGAAARTAHLADGLAEVGVTRITDFGRMPWPPAAWHHDGAGPLRELCRWVDREP